MRPSTYLQLASLALGLACAGVLIWLWHENFEQPAPVKRAEPKIVARTPSPAPRVGTAFHSAESDAATDALLSALAQAIASGNARAREAVLTFKDDAAMSRFLSRAAKSGLSVVGQMDRLRSARVRFDGFKSLQNELLENA